MDATPNADALVELPSALAPALEVRAAVLAGDVNLPRLGVAPRRRALGDFENALHDRAFHRLGEKAAAAAIASSAPPARADDSVDAETDKTDGFAAWIGGRSMPVSYGWRY